MKKITQAIFLGSIGSLLMLVGAIFPKASYSLAWWIITEFFYVIMLIRLWIPSREERLKKLHKKRWAVKNPPQ